MVTQRKKKGHGEGNYFSLIELGENDFPMCLYLLLYNLLNARQHSDRTGEEKV